MVHQLEKSSYICYGTPILWDAMKSLKNEALAYEKWVHFKIRWINKQHLNVNAISYCLLALCIKKILLNILMAFINI